MMHPEFKVTRKFLTCWETRDRLSPVLVKVLARNMNDIPIIRSPEVEDYIVVLDHHKTALDYQATYGDRIAEAYENQKLILLPSIRVDADLEFLNALTFPPQFKKISSGDGLGSSIMQRDGKRISRDPRHPINIIIEDQGLAVYANHQITSVFEQLRLIIRQLFPAYRSMREGALTWRFSETRDENMHYDYFDQDSRFYSRQHRVKFFINLDDAPRTWHLTHRIDRILRDHREIFPETLPYHLNDVASIASSWPKLQDLPYHELRFPQLSIVLGNAESIGHGVKYGNRVIGGEFFVPPEEMLNPRKSLHGLYDPLKKYGFS
jgi:hypothetical protein